MREVLFVKVQVPKSATLMRRAGRREDNGLTHALRREYDGPNSMMSGGGGVRKKEARVGMKEGKGWSEMRSGHVGGDAKRAECEVLDETRQLPLFKSRCMRLRPCTWAMPCESEHGVLENGHALRG